MLEQLPTITPPKNFTVIFRSKGKEDIDADEFPTPLQFGFFAFKRNGQIVRCINFSEVVQIIDNSNKISQ